MSLPSDKLHKAFPSQCLPDHSASLADLSLFWQLNKTRTRSFSKYSQNNLSLMKWLSHTDTILASDLTSVPLDLNYSLKVIKIKN